MRTTLTLDPDLAERLRQLAHERRLPFKQVVNDAIRRGLGDDGGRKTTFRVRTFDRAFRRGVDPLHLNRLVDDLEVDDGT